MYQLKWTNKKVWKRYAGEAVPAVCPDDKEAVRVSLLVWEEHCVECSAPQCFKSCGLYADRGDGNCRRFSYGIYPNRKFAGLFGYGADIRFKRWGKLEALWPERVLVYPVWKARTVAAVFRIHDFFHGKLLKLLTPGTKLFGRIQLVLRTAKGTVLKLLTQLDRGEEVFDALYIKLFSPETMPCNLQLELIQDVPVYRNSFNIVPGWNEFVVPFGQLDFAPGKGRYIRLWVDRDQEVRLIFTWLDLVKFKSQTQPTPKCPAEKVKCVAWDLDNTLWKGVIGDDGKDGVKVVSEALDLIRRLDQRGIIQTVVSKNEHATAWEKVVELGLADYFLYPAINWEPKSVNLQRIASELNININSFALIDDSEFERGEVTHACPQVRVYDPATMRDLLGRAEFDVPVTQEAGTRRLKYQEDIKRKSAHQAWAGDLDGFLKECCMDLNIRTIQNQNQIDRCLELLQRSNQFHLSGKRHTKEEFAARLGAAEYDSYALDVQDRYGDYGIIGFVSVEKKTDSLLVTEFVMSCRVARKKVENAFFYWYLNRKESAGKAVFASMKVTGRNQPLRQVFDELKFKVVEERDAEILMCVDAADILSHAPPISIKAMTGIEAQPVAGGLRPQVNLKPAPNRVARIAVTRPRDLTAEQLEAWSAIQSANPALESPFFRPEFTRALAAAADNIFVGVLRDEHGEPSGFFPFELVRPGFGRNLEMCDHQGVIAPAALEWDAMELLRGCGLKVWEFDHLTPANAPFRRYHCHLAESPQLDLAQGYEAYKAALNPDGKRHLAKTTSIARKTQRELGPLTLVPESDDPQLMATMHRWRAQKYGPLPDRAHAALEQMRVTRTPDFAGVLSALYAGEKLLAVHFGIRSRGVLHWWFPAYDPALANYAPGIQLMLQMAERAPGLGIAKIDLGKGMQDYKRRFRTAAVTVATGSVEVMAWSTLPRIVRRNGLNFLRRQRALFSLARRGKRLIKPQPARD